jgi:hypothetical protein
VDTFWRLRIVVASTTTYVEGACRPVIERSHATDTLTLAARCRPDTVRMGTIREQAALFIALTSEQLLIGQARSTHVRASNAIISSVFTACISTADIKATARDEARCFHPEDVHAAMGFCATREC